MVKNQDGVLSPEIDQLITGFDYYSTLKAQEFPDETMKQAVVRAAEAELESRIANLSEAGGEYLRAVHDTYSLQRAAAERVAGDLQALGIDPDDTLNARLAQIHEQGSNSLNRVASYFIGLLSDKLDETVDLSHTDESTPASSDSEQLDHDLTGVGVSPKTDESNEQEGVAKKSVKVGLVVDRENERGWLLLKGKRREKTVPLSLVRSPGERTDYSSKRIAALKVLLAEPERDFTPQELWKGIHLVIGFSAEDVPELDRDQLEKVRSYITDKTNVGWSKSPLIVHNGKRGLSSAYTVNSKFKDLIEVDISDDEIRELDKLLTGRYERLAQHAGATAASASQENDSHIDEVIPSIQELKILLGFLDFRQETILAILEGDEHDKLYNFVQNHKSILEQLESIAEPVQNDHTEVLTKEVISTRLDVINKILKIIEDENILQQVVERLEELDADEGSEAIYYIITEIKQLSEEDRKLLASIVQLSVEQRMIEFAGTFSKGSLIVGIDEEYRVGDHTYRLSDSGELVAEVGGQSFVYFDEDEDPEEENAVQAQLVEDCDPEEHYPGKSILQEEYSSETSDTGSDIRTPTNQKTELVAKDTHPVTDRHVRTKVKKRALRTPGNRLKSQLEALGESTQHLIEKGLMGGVFRIEDGELVNIGGSRQLEAVFGLKPRDVRNASENNLVSEDKQSKLTVTDVLRILAYKNHHRLFAVKKHSRLAEDTLKHTIASASD